MLPCTQGERGASVGDGATASSSAVRYDPGGRFEERLEFVETSSGGIATCLNVPRDDAIGGVVICSSLYNEFLKNYRREVMLARALARRRIAVIRLHYRGTGHSDGAPSDTTLERMREDALVAGNRLGDVTGTENLAYVGTRFGSLVAAAASASAAAPLALLEPVVEADRFFREGLRTILFSGVVRKRPDANGAPTRVDDLIAELAAAGEIDVLGYTIGLDLFDGTRGATLLTAMGPRPQPVLVVQLGSDDLRPELQRVVVGLEERGCTVTTLAAGTREAWWFAEEEEASPGDLENRAHGLEEKDPVVESVGTWLVSHLDHEGKHEPELG